VPFTFLFVLSPPPLLKVLSSSPFYSWIGPQKNGSDVSPFSFQHPPFPLPLIPPPGEHKASDFPRPVECLILFLVKRFYYPFLHPLPLKLLFPPCRTVEHPSFMDSLSLGEWSFPFPTEASLLSCPESYSVNVIDSSFSLYKYFFDRCFREVFRSKFSYDDVFSSSVVVLPLGDMVSPSVFFSSLREVLTLFSLSYCFPERHPSPLPRARLLPKWLC